MAPKKANKNLLFPNLIDEAQRGQDRDIAYTPLIAIVVAMFFDRLNFVFINSVIHRDEKRWRVSPDNLAKAIVLTPFSV